MKKKFKSKKTFKIKLTMYFLLFFVSTYLILGILFNGKIINIKEILLNSALKEVVNEDNYFLNKLNLNLTTPKNIIYASLNKIIPKRDLMIFSSNVEDDFFDYENSYTEYVEDPNPINVEKPIVYIYNTHQLEEYNMQMLFDYSVKPNVMIASYVLKEKLNELSIPSIVETANIKEYLNANRLNYSYSYTASKYYAEKALKKYPSIRYLIDIHRDSTKIDKTLYQKDGKEYAKILFLIGIENPNYQKNLDLAVDFNEYITSDYSGISRGIYKKGGKGVNGVYNQNLSENAMLIEIGGVDNTIEQVYNTCEVLAKKLSEFIKRRENGN